MDPRGENRFWGRWTFFDIFWPFLSFFMDLPHLFIDLWLISLIYYDWSRPARPRDSNLRPCGWEIRVPNHWATPVTQNSLRYSKYPPVQKTKKSQNMAQYVPICANMSQICPPTFRKNRFWGLWTFLYLFGPFVWPRKRRFWSKCFLVRSIN